MQFSILHHDTFAFHTSYTLLINAEHLILLFATGTANSSSYFKHDAFCDIFEQHVYQYTSPACRVRSNKSSSMHSNNDQRRTFKRTTPVYFRKGDGKLEW